VGGLLAPEHLPGQMETFLDYTRGLRLQPLLIPLPGTSSLSKHLISLLLSWNILICHSIGFLMNGQTLGQELFIKLDAHENEMKQCNVTIAFLKI
jgi:hypothetical protein